MKSGFVFICLLVILIGMGLGCGKSSSKTKPKLSLESINTVVDHNDSMRALFKLSNSKYLSNGTFVAIRTRINQLPCPVTDSVGLDTFAVEIPDFHGSSTGELRFALPVQGFLSEGGNIHQNDTLIYKFIAVTTDTAVRSDTVTSPKVVILNP